MKIKYYWDLIRGKTNAKNPAKLSFRNVLAVLQAWWRKRIRVFLAPHIYEQIVWRRLQVIEKSPECWKSGHCVFCGCEILGKTTEDRECMEEPSCYPSMMRKKKWKEFKNLYKIKLFE